ncbi:hypothetical protein [Streptomyces sp. NPDC003832]
MLVGDRADQWLPAWPITGFVLLASQLTLLISIAWRFDHDRFATRPGLTDQYQPADVYDVRGER